MVTIISPAAVHIHNKLYMWLLGIGAFVVLVLLTVAYARWDTLLFEDVLGLTFNGGPTVLLICGIFLVLSLAVVGADEVAGAFFYGKALKKLDSGLHIVPFGLMQVVRAPRTVQQFQCPDEPERVFKGDDRDQLPQGMVRAIRAVTREPTADEKGILDVQMTLDINFVVQYAIEDIFAYVANFGTVTNIEKQLRDIGEITVAEDITRNTPSSFIRNLPKSNKKLIITVIKRFMHSGVRVISVRLISPDVSHKVSSELANIPVERAKAQQTVIKAEADKSKRIKERQGDAVGELAWLKAQAEGRKKIKDDLEVDGDAVLASEAVRGILKETDVILAGGEGGMKDVMAFVKGAQSAFSSGTKKGVQP